MKHLILASTGAAVLAACAAPQATQPQGTEPGTPRLPAAIDVTAPSIDPGDGGDYRPNVPQDFAAEVTNPYLPYRAGSRWVYRGGGETIRVRVLPRTRTVMGIRATVVRDTVTAQNGDLIEDTFDWYAQDSEGNVWYLGEQTKEYKRGRVVSTAGSWEAGVSGAQPGVIMPAEPQVGQAMRLEYLRGEAEDLAQVVSTSESATVLGEVVGDVVRTKEWTPLEPDIVETKDYAPGFGQVAGRTVAGGAGGVRLVAYRPAS